MSPRRLLESALVVLLVSSFIDSTTLAKGTGLWRLPSSTAQYFGYGYGPGHHAPMIRSPGYRPPQVQRLKFIPAKQGPFCNAGNCQASAGYQSLPVEADMWALGALEAPAGMSLQPMPYLQHQPMAPQPAPAIQQTPAAQRSILFPPPKRALPADPPASKPSKPEPAPKVQQTEPKPTSENLPTPADEPEEDLLGDDDLEVDDLEADDLEEEELDEDEPAMPDAEPLPQPETKDETPRTEQARGPRVWNCR